MTTTYALARNPGLYSSIMLACRQCHAEAAQLLYSGHVFSFGTNVEAVKPFLEDLTPYSRACIKRIALVKRGLPYERESDRVEWESACKYLACRASDLTAFTEMTLGIVAGCPGPNGWEGVHQLQKKEFLDRIGCVGDDGDDKLLQLEYRDPTHVKSFTRASGYQKDEWEGVDWVQQLIAIEGLKELTVNAIVEHCPPPMSWQMQFWIVFSKSVEEGFADYLKEVMIRP